MSENINTPNASSKARKGLTSVPSGDTAKPNGAAPHPEDDLMAQLRVDVSNLEGGARRILLGITAQNPNKKEYIRVRCDGEFATPFMVFGTKHDRDFYVIAPGVAAELEEGTDYERYILYVYINRVGTVQVWPARYTLEGERQNEWHRTAHVAAAEAMARWVRVQANQDAGRYEAVVAEHNARMADPKWPDGLTFNEVLRLAFAKTGRFVDNVEHPLISALKGRV
jgi:hypothetical protein